MFTDLDQSRELFCCSVTKLCLTLCNPINLQHPRLSCPSLSPRVCSNSCPSSQWCYLIISSSATPFSFCFQSFPASRSSSMSWLHIMWPEHCCFNFSISPSNEYAGLNSPKIDWFYLLVVQGTLRVFSSTTI